MTRPHPRLLVATEFPPNASGGGPAVVRQMLKEWPADRLAWWSCLPERDRRFGREVAAHRVAEIPARLFPQIRWARPKAWLLERLWTPWATRHLRATIREVQPDVVWAIPHQWSILPLKATLPTSHVGFHVTVQDFADAGLQVARYGAERSRRLGTATDQLYAAATTRDATSHPMIDELHRRTSQDAAQMLHAGLEPEDFAFLEAKHSASRATIRIAHAGTIVVEDVFQRFVGALRGVMAANTQRIELHLFGAHSYASRSWFDAAWMSEHGNLAEAELLQRLREYDWGFSPMALTDENPRYNRFSFPTKFITYLAAGLPVMTIGAPESSVVQLARAYDVGLCWAGNDDDELARALSAACAIADPWARHKAEILRCARTEFDAARMRHRLHECFDLCAQSRGGTGALP